MPPRSSRLLLLASVVACATTLAPTSLRGQATLRAQLVGHWRLVSTEQVREGEPTTSSLGPAPLGMISYTADGHMQAQLTRATRPAVRTADATGAQVRELSRYTAYFGTYTVDERTRTVTHHRDGTFGPGERDFVRTAELSGSRLVLTTPAIVVDGKRRFARITWERLSHTAAASSFVAASRAAVAGTWELVEHKTMLPGGEVRRSFGSTPKGLFFFHPDGHTSVQIVNPDRPAAPLDAATDEDVRALMRTYLAYFGSYDVDPATKKIVVHTTADLNPLNTGVDQVRFYQLDGDLMYLQPPPSKTPTGEQVSRITWRRVK